MINTAGVWLGGEFVDEPADAQSSERIKSWLAALLDGEHLSLLTGNGLTAGVAYDAKLSAPSMTTNADFGKYTEQILADATNTSIRMGRGTTPNIEDKLRSAQKLLDGITVLSPESDEASGLEACIDEQFNMLIGSVLDFEGKLRASVGTSEYQSALNTVGRFLLAFAARPGGRERLHLFTTNYDRLIEHLCDQLGLRPLDRFVGGLEPKFRASRLDIDMHYNPPGARGEPRYLEGVLHFGKLHGSLDWKWEHSHGVYRQTSPLGVEVDSSGIASKRTLIYPRSTKDVETQLYPYAELFRDFAAAICRPHSVLFTFGYGFGDSHINRIIQDMLTIPSTHLVVCSFDPLESIDNCIGDLEGTPQITGFVGPEYASLAAITKWLPRLSSDPIVHRQGLFRSAARKATVAASETEQ